MRTYSAYVIYVTKTLKKKRSLTCYIQRPHRITLLSHIFNPRIHLPFPRLKKKNNFLTVPDINATSCRSTFSSARLTLRRLPLFLLLLLEQPSNMRACVPIGADSEARGRTLIKPAKKLRVSRQRQERQIGEESYLRPSACKRYTPRKKEGGDEEEREILRRCIFVQRGGRVQENSFISMGNLSISGMCVWWVPARLTDVWLVFLLVYYSCFSDLWDTRGLFVRRIGWVENFSGEVLIGM